MLLPRVYAADDMKLKATGAGYKKGPQCWYEVLVRLITQCLALTTMQTLFLTSTPYKTWNSRPLVLGTRDRQMQVRLRRSARRM